MKKLLLFTLLLISCSTFINPTQEITDANDELVSYSYDMKFINSYIDGQIKPDGEEFESYCFINRQKDESECLQLGSMYTDSRPFSLNFHSYWLGGYSYSKIYGEWSRSKNNLNADWLKMVGVLISDYAWEETYEEMNGTNYTVYVTSEFDEMIVARAGGVSQFGTVIERKARLVVKSKNNHIKEFSTSLVTEQDGIVRHRNMSFTFYDQNLVRPVEIPAEAKNAPLS